ncbi:PEP-CTERM sorting domain-containing protein [Luteolibacter sp. SL250]|uniref:PEP-CTERM sorting domain-containing protein n=1 Tax=Luteolibacter sp. SL250 TaxID=2995170 RepID=UPI00226E0D46|nr:PEP-CTERM sorting domain-containing protein [Luteolibacter sp. SL250]WAC21499.1 PEP-CTERM sorting domain-containing protein [Luteolibacter sp. SL250]
MKRSPWFGTAAAFLCLSAVCPAAITSYFADFSGDETSLTSAFAGASDAAVPGWTWNGTAGVGGGEGILVGSSSSNKYYRPTPGADATSAIDLAALSSGQGFRSSADFRWSDIEATDLTVLNFGFVTTQATAMSSTNSMGGSIIRSAGGSGVTLRLRSGTSDVETLSFNQSLFTAGNWYRLVYETVKTDTANTFASVLTLYSIGADGTATPVVMDNVGTPLTISSQIGSSVLYSDSAAFAAYDVRNTNGISAMDNLRLEFIPEPSAAALLAVGMAGMAVRRRRGL